MFGGNIAPLEHPKKKGRKKNSSLMRKEGQKRVDDYKREKKKSYRSLEQLPVGKTIRKDKKKRKKRMELKGVKAHQARAE